MFDSGRLEGFSTTIEPKAWHLRLVAIGISAGTHPTDESCRSSTESDRPTEWRRDVLNYQRDMVSGCLARLALNPKAASKSELSGGGSAFAFFQGIAR